MRFPLLEKPKGGYRPILLCASLVRLWQRLRRPQVLEATKGMDRSYWAFGQGMFAERTV